MAKKILLFALMSAAAPVCAQVAVSTAAPVTVEQAYRPVNGRDPLVPATVYGDQKAPGRASAPRPAAGVAVSSFSVYGLTLTGILEDSRGRQALLRDASGAVYMLKAGKLIDSKKKTVPGVSGVVKGKQVVLMTEDKKVCHLNLRENEQAGE